MKRLSTRSLEKKKKKQKKEIPPFSGDTRCDKMRGTFQFSGVSTFVSCELSRMRSNRFKTPANSLQRKEQTPGFCSRPPLSLIRTRFLSTESLVRAFPSLTTASLRTYVMRADEEETRETKIKTGNSRKRGRRRRRKGGEEGQRPTRYG